MFEFDWKIKNYVVTIRIPMISPKRPMALPKISMIKILTKSEGLAASARAAPDPRNTKYYC